MQQLSPIPTAICVPTMAVNPDAAVSGCWASFRRSDVHIQDRQQNID
jgi:hypothetical protein